MRYTVGVATSSRAIRLIATRAIQAAQPLLDHAWKLSLVEEADVVLLDMQLPDHESLRADLSARGRLTIMLGDSGGTPGLSISGRMDRLSMSRVLNTAASLLHHLKLCGEGASGNASVDAGAVEVDRSAIADLCAGDDALIAAALWRTLRPHTGAAAANPDASGVAASRLLDASPLDMHELLERFARDASASSAHLMLQQGDLPAVYLDFRNRTCYSAGTTRNLVAYFHLPLARDCARMLRPDAFARETSGMPAFPVLTLRWAHALHAAESRLRKHLSSGARYAVNTAFDGCNDFAAESAVARALSQPRRLLDAQRLAGTDLTTVIRVVNSFDSLDLLSAS